MLRSSKDVQKWVSNRVTQLEKNACVKDTEHKVKPKQGGNVDVSVAKQVAWPQPSILGGPTKQHKVI